MKLAVIGCGYWGPNLVRNFVQSNKVKELICCDLDPKRLERMKSVYPSVEVLSDYKELLQIFFTLHDPTTLNRQGADVGTQYRSAIFYRDDEQRKTAMDVIREVDASKVWKKPIVTELVPFKAFYKAEDYHQEYFQNNPQSPYCQVVIEPKIAKLREYYREKLKR